jgi:hypothetical protein
LRRRRHRPSRRRHRRHRIPSCRCHRRRRRCRPSCRRHRLFDCCVFVVVVVVVRRRPTSIIRCRARLPSSSPHPLSSASTARFRCSQRDDIAVAVISATSSSLPNDNGQRRDRNGRRRRNGRRDGGNGSPLSLTATTFMLPPTLSHALARRPHLKFFLNKKST